MYKQKQTSFFFLTCNRIFVSCKGFKRQSRVVRLILRGQMAIRRQLVSGGTAPSWDFFVPVTQRVAVLSAAESRYSDSFAFPMSDPK